MISMFSTGAARTAFTTCSIVPLSLKTGMTTETFIGPQITQICADYQRITLDRISPIFAKPELKIISKRGSLGRAFIPPNSVNSVQKSARPLGFRKSVDEKVHRIGLEPITR